MSFMTHDDSQMFTELCYPVEQMGVYSKISTKFNENEVTSLLVQWGLKTMLYRSLYFFSRSRSTN